MDLNVNFADDILDARLRLHLTQIDLAARLGVSPRTVQNWEAGMEPQIRHRRLIAEFLEQTKEASA